MKPVVNARIYSRRQLLVTGAAGAVLPTITACDRLVLPDGDTLPGILPITPNDSFYVTSCCDAPVVDPDTWALEIRDRGVVRATITLDLLQQLLDDGIARDKEHTLQCIGSSPHSQLISNAVWTGIPLPELLDQLGAGIRADALELVFYGAEGYATSIPRADYDHPIWLVWRMNGEELPLNHGFPARLLVPGRYGTKNVKWITAIDAVDSPFVGFWEERGWSNDASYLPNVFIASPIDGGEAPAPITLIGTAFAGDDEVVAVEVTHDGGETWSEAEITYQAGPDVWTLWRFDFEAEPGEYRLRTRVTTMSGAQSTDVPQGTDFSHGYDGGMEIRVTVT